MKAHTDFDFLSGIVRVGAAAPAAWQDDKLAAFFTDPNHVDWGAPLCRRLYHETLHFWQLLGWGYVANCAAADWERVLSFEQTGAVPPPSARGLDAMGVAGDGPFSPRDLMEAVARFWDVHTRSPAQVIADEGLADAAAQAVGPLTVGDPHGGDLVAYTHHAFDFVMQHGPDCQSYAEPYRWLLKRVQGASAFAVIMFPLCAHAAMGTPDPVRVFCATIDLALDNPMVSWLMNRRSGSIHSDWMMFWPPLTRNVFGPASVKAGVMQFTSGFDVIHRGSLQHHPVYREYLDKAHFRGWFKMHQPVPTSSHPLAVQHASDLKQAALENPLILFALPGEPVYRRALAETVAPPLIRFANFEVATLRPVLGKVLALQQGTHWDDDFGSACANLERRLARFRDAEYAASIGLPLDAFEAKAAATAN